MSQLDLSIVVPVYNERGNVALLHKAVVEVCSRLTRSFEVIFVDDGSTDGTFEELNSCQAPLKIIRLRKRSGQTAALDAGLKAAKGKLIVTMDGDLQNDPEDIPAMINLLERDDLDVVCGWRKDRKDPLMKRLISKGAKFLRDRLIHDGVHDAGCALKVFRRECFETIELYGEMHRFLVAMLMMKGFKVGEMVVRHHERKNGKTKYRFDRTIKGFIDMLSIWFWKKYANRPLHLLGGAGLAMLAIGTVTSGWSFYLKLFEGQDLSDTLLPVLSMFLFFSGLSMFMAGILADMISKTYYENSRDQTYLIKETVEKPHANIQIKSPAGAGSREPSYTT